MDNNIENNSDNNDNKNTLLGSFDVIDLFRKNTDNTNENKNTNKLTALLITNDDASKILEILKEIICDFYYG